MMNWILGIVWAPNPQTRRSWQLMAGLRIDSIHRSPVLWTIWTLAQLGMGQT